MKFKKTKAAALALAATLACGSLSGCAFVTQDPIKDLNQTIAAVDISNGEAFASGGEYASYKDAVSGIASSTSVLKRDLVANFANYGSTYMNYYGYTQEDTYDLMKNSLVNRQIYLQYAMVYFFESGEYNVDGYNREISQAEEGDKEIAGLRYFLTPEERAQAEYSLKQTFNSSLDSQETEVIAGLGHTHNHDEESAASSSRTTPTGVDTENEDFVDPSYKIYTGFGAETDASSPVAANCGSYETVDDSTPTSRRQAYKRFLANLDLYGLIEKGENTSDITSLKYYALERRSQYESALINKLSDAFEKEAEAKITKEWIEEEKYQKTLATQKELFDGDASAVETALDGVSDSNYVFYAPDDYGFVINILLPFSTAQTQELNDSPADFGDKQGNKFVTRAGLLKKLTATDQRSAWFTSDYSFEAEEADGAYTAGNSARKYLFFENSLKKSVAPEGETAQYEALKNYYGKYTYNGSVNKTEDEHGDAEYSFDPNKITIDGFIGEMKNYLEFAGLHLTEKFNAGAEYYTKSVSDYYQGGNTSGKVDYSSFLYYEGKIDELATFDANKVFLSGSTENKAMSVINELSFAYNTDTAGLNTYLGYAVTPNKTDFVSEFEYAAQQAVRGGVGTVTVAPSTYGWHIMYCTFSYAGNRTPYTFNWDEIEVEGTFSNLYFEAMKASNLSAYASDRQTTIINSFDNDDCVTVWENRYSDLF